MGEWVRKAEQWNQYIEKNGSLSVSPVAVIGSFVVDERKIKWLFHLNCSSGLKVVDGGLGPWGVGAPNSVEGSSILRKEALVSFLGGTT